MCVCVCVCMCVCESPRFPSLKLYVFCAELQEALQGGGGGGGGANPGICQDVSGSPDSLTNMLVYQYLAGQLPEGSNGATTHGRSVAPSAVLQALVADRLEVGREVVRGRSLGLVRDGRVEWEAVVLRDSRWFGERWQNRVGGSSFER